MSDENLRALARRYQESGDLEGAEAYLQALLRSGQRPDDGWLAEAPLLAFLDGVQRADPRAVEAALEALGDLAEEVLLVWLSGLAAPDLAWLVLVGLLDDPRIGDGERVRLYGATCAALQVEPADPPRGHGLVEARERVERYYPRNSVYYEGGPAPIRLRALAPSSPRVRRALQGARLLARARPVITAAVGTILRDPAAGSRCDYPEFELAVPGRRPWLADDPQAKLRGQEALLDTHLLARVLDYLARHPALLAQEDELAGALADLIAARGDGPEVAFHVADRLLAHLPHLPEHLALAALGLAPAWDYSGKEAACAGLVECVSRLEHPLRGRAEAVLWDLIASGAGADVLVPRLRDGLEGAGIADPFLREHYAPILLTYARCDQPTPTGRVAQLFAGGRDPYPELEQVRRHVQASRWDFVQDVLRGVDWDVATAEWA